MEKQQFLKFNQHIIKDKTILDLACHEGVSSRIIKNFGAKHIFGVEARPELVEIAKNKLQGNVEFFVGDIQNSNLIVPLVEKSQTVIALGVLYHLYNHFGFLSNILRPNIEHVLIETVAGPETLDTAMDWTVEDVKTNYNGWHPDKTRVLCGTPNLSWIFETAEIFDFKCDWVHSFGELPPKSRHDITHNEYIQIKENNWPDYETITSDADLPDRITNAINTRLVDDGPAQAGNKRILIRLYNTKNVDSKPVDLEQCYRWFEHRQKSL